MDLRGRLGSSPMTFAADRASIGPGGSFAVAGARLALGEGDGDLRLRLSRLGGTIGAAVSGDFDGLDASLAAVPLDVSEGSGSWAFADQTLDVLADRFLLTDRQDPQRFEPLIGRAAGLEFSNGLISANADLYPAAGGPLLARVDLSHDLDRSAGGADIDVPGIRFAQGFQPDDLTFLTKGVVAKVDGVVTGSGRIDWSASGVTSSGAFSSDDLDFAAAFGPVEGASGTVRFSDLLALTTEPAQTIRVASVNPGIEVLDGTFTFSLRDGEFLDVEGGVLQFAGGDLIVRPLRMQIGAAEERRYVFEVRGLDASLFVERLELSNISATGVFDGMLPLIFDANGDGRIENGLLVSRPPGGNIAYVGELTYEDLNPIANFAFDALRSLDYRTMTVLMDGPLTGELVTRVEFDGVTQGDGAKRNFLTRRLGRLPIAFRINIRAPFAKMLASLASISDPAMVRDPRDLGLVDGNGTRLRPSVTGEEAEAEALNDAVDALTAPPNPQPANPAPPPDPSGPDEQAATPIQRKESENMP